MDQRSHLDQCQGALIHGVLKLLLAAERSVVWMETCPSRNWIWSRELLVTLWFRPAQFAPSRVNSSATSRLAGIRTMEQNISRSMAEPRFRTVLLAPVSRSARRRGMEGVTHDMPVHSEELSRGALAIIGFDQTRWPRLFVLWPLQRVPSASYTPDTSAA